ncbi:Putative zinc metalloprotease [Polystyrenella longa]|uniref:Zinc metalloprotease n=1 Tax=Polystyrenella longa TaxID=2528007 RepID=A0A518CT46_9PLAN|nr:RIP metalloprotease RseP [Polystyrenella longa]QDU82403.1 Putative zinc metalloprotease [Polystyrenella longa]
MELMFAITLTSILNWVYVALGLGLVIFFHELGHFAVAKWCNVYVERFSIGFGPVIWSFRKGETEYALSIVPFGGYVKMLGQDDMDPSQLSSEEIAQDPRAYSAKNVWQRMAIISAGVIMNILTAILFFAYAFSSGIENPTAVVGSVQAGLPAWEKGMQSGDRITEINGRKINSFMDIKRGVALSSGPLDIKAVRRSGEEFSLTILPEQKELGRMIGTAYADGLRTAGMLEGATAGAAPDTPAATAEPPVPMNARIINVNGEEIDDPFRFQQILAQKRAEPLEITFQVLKNDEKVTTTIPAQPFQELGIQVDIGQLLAIQQGSPAETAGLKKGDKIMQVDGRGLGNDLNPLHLPEYFASKHGSSVDVTIKRENEGGEVAEMTISVIPQNRPGWVEAPYGPDVPLSIPSIGVAFNLINRVLKIQEGSPAATAGLQANDALISIEFIPPPKKDSEMKPIKLSFDQELRNWAHAIWYLQRLPGWEVKVAFSRSNQVQTVSLEPVESKEWFMPTERGIYLLPQLQTQKANGIGEAIGMGFDSTINSVTDIYLTLRNLFTADLSVKNLRGPIGIASVSHSHASRGMPYLAWFLGMLSVNLAVLNFLPIPVLDGGHMVFLLWEAITRKKPSERVVIAATYVGMMIVLGLMVLVLYLDIFVHWLQF